jgi:hypothetical protein
MVSKAVRGLGKVRRLQWSGVLLGACLIGFYVLPSAAGAAPASAHRISAQTGPVQAFGTAFGVTACGFAPHALIDNEVNGTSASSTRAGGGGCVSFRVAVADPRLTVEGGVSVSTKLGRNEIPSHGARAGGGIQTDTYTFHVVRAADAASRTTITGSDVMASVIGALALLSLGFLVVTFSRRRSSPA